MPIPTESSGSILHSRELLTAMGDHAAGRITDAQLEAAQREALRLDCPAATRIEV
jgi:hypothetical protein